MKNFNLTKDKLEEFTAILSKAVYLSNGWDEPTVILLDSVRDCEIFYLKLLNPLMMVDKSLLNNELNNISANFWANNGHKYNWDFLSNNSSYGLEILVAQKSTSTKASYLYHKDSFRVENILKLGDKAMVGLQQQPNLFVEVLEVLSLPEDFPENYLKPILKAILVDELLDYCLFNHLCVFCNAPIISYDSEDRLHHPFGPAILFPNGESYFYFKGREVTKHWILNPDEVSREDLLAVTNVEQRRILHEIIGDERFAKLLNLKVTEIESYNGQAVYLMRTASPDRTIEDYLYFIKVICNSTQRQYHICIPEDAYNLGAIGALAWTFGMEAQEYQLLIET
jgi:hypothetical protein